MQQLTTLFLKNSFLFILLGLFISFSACESMGFGPKKKDKEPKKVEVPKDGLVKTYYEDGKLFGDINYKNGKRHGISTSYRKDGKVSAIIEYVDGKKHGLSKFHYPAGQLFRETLFENDVQHGIQKAYHQNGKLKFEADFFEGYAGTGLKEFDPKGKVFEPYKDMKMVLQFYEAEPDAKKDPRQFILHAKLNKEGRKVKFFTGELKDGKFLHAGLKPLKMRKNQEDVGTLTYSIPANEDFEEEINIIAEVETPMKKSFVFEQKMTMKAEAK